MKKFIGKGMGGHQSANMGKDEWLTDPAIIKELGPFDLDPCAPIVRPWDTAKKHFTIEDNGLIQRWEGRVWLNPPYGVHAATWMQRMAQHDIGTALLFARTETAMYFEWIWEHCSAIMFLKGRLTFYNVDGTPGIYNSGAPSALITYGKQDAEIMDACKIKGKIFHNTQTVIIVGISPTWFSVVSIAIRTLGEQDLQPIYEVVERMAPDKIAKNQNWKAKIRQQVAVYRRKSAPTYSSQTIF